MQHNQSDDFVEYLRAAIRGAGYSTPTQFARKAELDPSVVLRWLTGGQRPTIRSLERVAPLLGRSTSEMVRAAYPDRFGRDDKNAAPMHELGYEVGRLLGADSNISAEDRRFLERLLNTILEPYRPRKGRRRSDEDSRPGRSIGGGKARGSGKSEARIA